MSQAFADRLVQRVRKLGHPLCVGLDPHLDRMPPLFGGPSMDPAAPGTAAAVETFCLAMLDRVAEHVPAVKPQSAFFEALGPAGVAVLGRVVAAARARGLLVILDAKRGDIGSTASAYARAYLAPDAPLAADALTVNPYLGIETLEPFVSAAQASGAGLFVLVKTSNPGSGDLQDLEVAGGGGGPAFARIAAGLVPLAARLRGSETEWSGLGAVVGAPYPEPSLIVRDVLPRSLFLVPGYGSQGGSATDAIAAFVPGPDGRLEGGVVNSSRAILFPPAAARARTSSEWERAIDTALAEARAELTEAVESV